MTTQSASPSSTNASCKCGYVSSSTLSWEDVLTATASDTPECDQKGIDNHRDFPSFSDLPNEFDVDEDYYRMNPTSGIYEPFRHWCFAAQISDVYHFVRYRVMTETKFGEKVTVHFYLDNGAAQPKFFNFQELCQGSTLCILYPYVREFMDGTSGIRQENASTVMLFPVPLPQLTTEVAALQLASDPQLFACVVCRKPQSSKKCGACKYARYCSKECQTKHWGSGHKQLCRHTKMLTALALLNFKTFRGFLDWEFQSEEEEKMAGCRAMVGDLSPSLSLGPLRQLLNRVADKDLSTDPISQSIACSIRGKQKRKKVQQTAIYKQLMNFCELQAQQPRERHFVVDMNGNLMHDTLMLTAVLMSLPKWQHSFGMRNICWALETHDWLWLMKEMYAEKEWNFFRSDQNKSYECIQVQHESSFITSVWADNMQVVAELAEAIAQKRKDCIVVRVIRVTGNRSYHEIVRELATRKDSHNIFTLWIRESLCMCGKFNPLDQKKALVEQLLDIDSNMLDSIMNANQQQDYDDKSGGDDDRERTRSRGAKKTLKVKKVKMEKVNKVEKVKKVKKVWKVRNKTQPSQDCSANK
mmetsp:Transcript_26075/g.42616  ORF Transcript_26075/g.42616 Transcript_26075/m.42616 type:complete len:584 (-) Transcript_26075:100-1851(-)